MALHGHGKIEKVMGEFKRGTLHSGSSTGPVVTSREQAVAIALSEERRRSTRGSRPFTLAEIAQGYRKLE